MSAPPSIQRWSRVWYLQSALYEFAPVYPVYALMMLDQISPAELALCFMVWSGVALAAEVPSGVLSDLLPRRRVLLVASIFKTACFLCWLAFPNLAGFLSGFVCWGIASALRSGTADALLFESLAARAETGAYDRIYGRGHATARIAIAMSLAIGGWWVAAHVTGDWFSLETWQQSWNDTRTGATQDGQRTNTLPAAIYSPVLLVSALGPLLAALLVYFEFGEPPRTALPDAEDETPLGLAWREARHSPSLRYLVVALSTVPVVHGVFDEFVSPLLAERGVALAWLGLVYAACFVASALGAYFAERLPAGDHRAPLNGAIAGAVLLLLILLPWPVAIAIGLTLHYGFGGLVQVRMEASLQHGMSGSARATVVSLARFGELSAAVLLYLMFGMTAQWHSFAGIAVATTLTTLAICGVMWQLGNRWAPARPPELAVSPHTPMRSDEDR